MVLYAATTNQGKLRDFAHATDAVPQTGQPIRIQPLPEIAAIPAPDEDGLTFDSNARIKAVYYSLRAPGHLILADDSGLEVDALNGSPGVRSARFAADSAFPIDRRANTLGNPPEDTLDARNNAALLHALANVPDARRQARYRCVLALARDGEVLITAEGTVEGRILTAPRGAGGFGYDPLFFLPERNRTMSELPATDRLALNHRGRALRMLLQRLA